MDLLDDDLFDDNAVEQMIALSDSLTETTVKVEIKDEPISQPLSQKYSKTAKIEPDPLHLDVLSRCFGHSNFRPLQWDIISAIIEDRRDVCAVMTTGYGKSLCYQYPSTFLGGITLVISPLISLMQDQILQLNVNNIPACLLGTAQKEKGKVMRDIFNDAYNIIYLTPEFCCGDGGKHMLKRMAKELKIALIAIDEAHCISSWGHDFRKQFRELGMLRDIFPGVPLMAVTATATPRVRLDITLCLRMNNPLNVCSGFNRPNLYLEIKYNDGSPPIHQLKKAMVFRDGNWMFSGPTIVYVIRRADADEMADTLQRSGINALPYHAGMPQNERTENHEKFVRDKVDVICATIAFGMGIDKPDVRNIIHFGCSGSVESYYQEVGRAGRDGLPANCLTIWSMENINTLRAVVEIKTRNPGALARKEEQLQMLMSYYNHQACRRGFILKYFGDDVTEFEEARTNCCDNCSKLRFDRRTPHERFEGLNDNDEYDFTDDARILLQAISALGGNFGLTAYIQFLKGSKNAKIIKFSHYPGHGSGKHKTDEWWKIVAEVLKRNKFFQDRRMDGNFGGAIISLAQPAVEFLRNTRAKIMAQPPANALKFLKPKQRTESGWLSAVKVNPNKSPNKTIVEDPKVIEERMNLYRKLLTQRTLFATELDCMPYSVASNTALMQMARFKPKNMEELRSLNVDGFNEAKLVKFGAKFLSLIDPTIADINQGASTSTSKMSIKDILRHTPLPNVKSSMSAEITFNFFTSGLTVGEIAAKRRTTVTTINNHLLISLKMGYPIKLSELGIAQETVDKVVQAVFKEYGEDISNAQVRKIAATLPTIEQSDINFVVAYLQIRQHLKQLNSSYVDFEDLVFESLWIQKSDTPTNETDDFSTKIDSLLEFCDDLIKKEESISGDQDANDIPNTVVKTEPANTPEEDKPAEPNEFDVILDFALPKQEPAQETADTELPDTGKRLKHAEPRWVKRQKRIIKS